MNILESILSHKNQVVWRTIRPQFLDVLTYVLVVEDARTLEFYYPVKTVECPILVTMGGLLDGFPRFGCLLDPKCDLQTCSKNIQ